MKQKTLILKNYICIYIKTIDVAPHQYTQLDKLINQTSFK